MRPLQRMHALGWKPGRASRETLTFGTSPDPNGRREELSIKGNERTSLHYALIHISSVASSSRLIRSGAPLEWPLSFCDSLSRMGVPGREWTNCRQMIISKTDRSQGRVLKTVEGSRYSQRSAEPPANCGPHPRGFLLPTPSGSSLQLCTQYM